MLTDADIKGQAYDWAVKHLKEALKRGWGNGVD
jgi:hypothetical protein